VARDIAISAYHRRRRARPREIPLDENTIPMTDDGLDRMFDAWLMAKALNSIGREHRAVIASLKVTTPAKTLVTIGAQPPVPGGGGRG
jgi:hypothetical protein